MAKLTFYFGTMNSGKSCKLIVDAYNKKQQGKVYLAFKPASDTRTKKIQSRAIKSELDCTLVPHGSVGVMTTLAKVYKSFDLKTIYVDEVQFMSKEQIDELGRIVDELNVDVQAYGLMVNFKGKLFDGSKRIVELADEIIKIDNECVACSNNGVVNARFVSGRLVTTGKEIEVGGNELYKVLCRKCFTELKTM